MAMATMVPEPYVNHIPTMTGGSGATELRAFYRDHFIGQWPADTKITPISRTMDDERIVDEMLITLTHDKVVDALLPGVPPTGRCLKIPTVVIARFKEGKVASEHIYWDQASVLVQAGLLDAEGLPVAGVEIAAKLVDPSRPSNALITQTSRGTN